MVKSYVRNVYRNAKLHTFYWNELAWGRIINDMKLILIPFHEQIQRQKWTWTKHPFDG